MDAVIITPNPDKNAYDMAIAVLMAAPMLRITVDEKVVFRIVATATGFESFSEPGLDDYLCRNV